MSTIVILGNGALGRAVADACPRVGPRPAAPRPPDRARAMTQPRSTAPTSWSRRRARTRCSANIRGALDAGVRRFVIATTGWESDRAGSRGRLVAAHGATAVASANFSLGAALFARLVDDAVALFGHAGASIHSSSNGIGPASATGRRARPATSPAGSWPAIPAFGRPTTSRSSRSGPACRRACTWSASMRSARPSSSG